MAFLARAVRVLWAGPNSLIGLVVGVIGLTTSGNVQVRRGVVEFWGGFSSYFIWRLPRGHSTAAMTLGHTILGRNLAALDSARDHEHVHVKQYERWGPFFIPAYLGSSAWMWLRGRDAYRDNPFEAEAFADDARRLAEAMGRNHIKDGVTKPAGT